MKHWIGVMMVAGCSLVGSAGEVAGGLDGASGHVHKVDLEARTFELLKETEYDPKTDIGQSRFTVQWEPGTLVFETVELKSFEGIGGPVMAQFKGINPANRKALAAGQPFEARVATLFADPRLAQGVVGDENSVVGEFTPAADGRAGVVVRGGMPQPVRLRDRHWKIYQQQPVAHARLAEGFWKVVLAGESRDGRFVASRMEVAPLPDPRETDDPGLPRVLVIGDSISMNYHEATKAQLEGVANYHRCEGNAFSSAHGVRNAELWMGNFNEPGFGWDVIQFNHGLHDLKQAYDAASDTFGAYAVPLDEYQRNLERMIGILKRSGAKLVWCSTTPVPNDNKGTYARRKGAAAEFNAAAREVMGRHPEILVTDLHGMISASPVFDAWRRQADVHFYRDEERQAIGVAVAAGIREALGGVR